MKSATVWAAMCATALLKMAFGNVGDCVVGDSVGDVGDGDVSDSVVGAGVGDVGDGVVGDAWGWC